MARLNLVEREEATGKARELLDGAHKKIGMTPNLYRAMANSPAVLSTYLAIQNELGQGELNAQVREQIALTVGEANNCDYCLAAHTLIGKSTGLDEAALEDARRGNAEDAKTNAALQFAQRIVNERGFVTDEDIAQAREAGLTDGELAEVVANVAANIFTNYFNHVTDTPVDFPRVEALAS